MDKNRRGDRGKALTLRMHQSGYPLSDGPACFWLALASATNPFLSARCAATRIGSLELLDLDSLALSSDDQGWSERQHPWLTVSQRAFSAGGGSRHPLNQKSPCGS